MVWGAGRVGGYLPAVTAEIVMVLLADLLLHQPQAAHNTTPDSGFHRGMDTGFIVDGDNALFRQIPGSFPDGRGVVLRTGGNFRKCEITSLPIGVCKPHSLSIWHNSAHCLSDIVKLRIGQLSRRRYDLLQYLVIAEWRRLYIRVFPDIVVISSFPGLFYQLPKLPMG